MGALLGVPAGALKGAPAGVPLGAPEKEKGMMNMNINLTDNDKRILTILYKFQWCSAANLALLIDEPVSFVTRRCIRLQEAGLIGREYLAGGVLSCNYIKAKGMKMMGFIPRKVSKPTLYNYEHTLGEINVYTFLAINPTTHIKLGQIITERDILNSVVWDDDGLDKQGRRRVIARDLTLGIHRPDGYIVNDTKDGRQFIALEFERSKKSAKSNSHLLDNIESNARVFNSGQWWFVVGNQIKNKIDKVKRDEHKLKQFNYDLVLNYLEQRKEDLPTTKASKEDREQRDYIGELITPVALSDIPKNKNYVLEL